VPNYIALAVPFFFLLIAGELLWARARGRSVYRLDDSLTDIACGVASELCNIFGKAAKLAIYAWEYERCRLISPPTAAAWLLAFLGVDFAYYWWHRASHRVNWLWAAHVVHHQSEDYNFAVALRQSILTSWTSLPFYLPLALLGVPPLLFAAMLAASTLYQFWIHTQLVGKFSGLLDRVLNLPSHHRVHHAVNQRYLDKNYGATLIVWDRLFGSYAEETEAPVYGITKPLRSFNVWWAQVHYWVELARSARRTPRLADKLRLFWMPPDWLPPGSEAAAEPSHVESPHAKYETQPRPPLTRYLVLQFGVVVALATWLMFAADSMPLGFDVAAAAVLLLSLLAFGALLERRRWARPLEAARLLAGAGVLAWLLLAAG
jgi:sterol desaturase/sphingolipid hydroxylase (fatty acid hydroxylase superfamily)